MYKYQNISKSTQTVTASGNINPRVVKSGEECVSDVAIENPNFKYVGEAGDNKVQGVITQTSPNAVTQAEQLNNETNKEN